MNRAIRSSSFWADGAPSGVVGLVAGNLKEKYNRPTIVFAPKQDSSGKTVWTGSGRSIKGFHLLNALKTCEDFFLAYGGHELAAGMSIPENEEVLSQLRTRLNQVAEYLSETDLMPMNLLGHGDYGGRTDKFAV